MTAISPSTSASRPTKATATPSISRAGRSPPSAPGWSASSITARSRCWPNRPTASRSTGRTTWSCIPTTSRSGSPIPAMARSTSTKGSAPTPARSSPIRRKRSIASTRKTGQVTKVADEPFKPNGIAFSHDYKKVYVCDTGITHYPNAKNIVWQYDLNGAKLSNPRTLIDMTLDGKSGFRMACGSIPRQYLGRRRLGRRRL